MAKNSRRSTKIRAERRAKNARKWGKKENGPRGRAPEPLIAAPPARNLNGRRGRSANSYPREAPTG